MAGNERGAAIMKIVFLTPGTGSFYCGACMRDNVLAKCLRAAGHDVSLLPMYLPLQLDDELLEGADDAPLFFGGINVYLQQRYRWFRHTPSWLDRWLDNPRLLRRAARLSHMTSAADHGEMCLAMLRVEQSGLRKELEKLLDWLAHEKPDVLCLSTALQAGMIRELKQRLGARIICCFQGEDGFLDSLPATSRADCWQELALRVLEADALVAPSVSYAAFVRQRLGTPGLVIEVIPNGIDLAGYGPPANEAGPPVIGYLARMIPEKGIAVMVDAFIHLKNVLDCPDVRLHLAGAVTAGDQPLLDSLQRKLADAGLSEAVRWSPNLSRSAKAEMLRALTLFSVPAIYQEAFGLYVVEAMASGVPVVQPDAASFREIVGPSGSGLLVPPGDAVALAEAWHGLLQDAPRRRELGARGRRTAEESYSATTMAARFLALARRVNSAIPHD